MKKVLMILTSHRLDCLKLALALLDRHRQFAAFDNVVFLLNGVVGEHLHYIERFMASRPSVKWDTVAGPRGRSECISNLENRCVERHPESVYVKMDEDIFVTYDWAQRMFEAYEAHRNDPNLALITPLIPNNAYGLWYLLSRVFPEALADFRQKFGAEPSPEIQGITWRLPSVAEWAIRRFVDIEAANTQVRERVASANLPRYHRFTDRFSIGCILFDYRHWLEMRGIPPKDEPEWCEWIEMNGKFNVLDSSQLVQHYSFFVQQDWLDRSTALEDLTAVNLGVSMNAFRRHMPRIARFIPQIPTIIRGRFGLAAK